MRISRLYSTIGTLLLCATTHAAANDFTLKVGVGVVDPKHNNGLLAGTLHTEVDSQVGPIISGEYHFTPNWGLEVLAALPFEHDVDLNGVKAATVKHLPPTVTLNYHFNPEGKVRPFIGIGVNYTWFFDEDLKLPGKLALSNSFGLAAHAGLDFELAPRWLLTVDARWIDIDSTVRLDGNKIGTVHVDPLVYAVTLGYTF